MAPSRVSASVQITLLGSPSSIVQVNALAAVQLRQAGAVGADPQVGGVILEHREDVVVDEAVAPGDGLERHVAQLVEAAVPRGHPDAALAILEQGRDVHPLEVGVADGRARHQAVADEPRHAGGASRSTGRRGDRGSAP